jgi:hypothetical protein
MHGIDARTVDASAKYGASPSMTLIAADDLAWLVAEPDELENEWAIVRLAFFYFCAPGL